MQALRMWFDGRGRSRALLFVIQDTLTVREGAIEFRESRCCRRRWMCAS